MIRVAALLILAARMCCQAQERAPQPDIPAAEADGQYAAEVQRLKRQIRGRVGLVYLGSVFFAVV